MIDDLDRRTARQRRRDLALYQAQTRGGEIDDYLEERDKRTWSGNGKYPCGERRGEVTDEYIYQDKDGQPYLRVERTEDKQFPQSHWDGTSWVYGKPKGPKIPYRLQELLASSPETPVFICEGEKDADNVAALSLTTTTSSEGAGKWTPDLNPWFRGKQTVFVLADNDDAGIRHARKVAQSLRDIVTDVRIVELPDQQEGGDVSDWLDAGGKKDELLRLCAASAVYEGGSGLDTEQAAEVARLAALHPLEYDRERSSIAERLGVRVCTLDAAVEKERRCAPGPSEDARLQGRAMALPELEPWPQAVEGEHLLRDMVAAIRRHVILSEHEALTAALWVLHAHALAHAEHSPRLHIASPEKRCGKTVLLRTIEPMVPRPLSAENITTSALFRVVEMVHPTLLIDEADAFLTDNEELRGLLNAGHARGGTVIRSVGDDHEPRAFHVWGAIVIAGIGRIPATLEDRSITIHLRRRLPAETIVRLRSSRREHLAELGRKATRWVVDHEDRLRDADPRLPETLGDRQQDNWRMLIAIADAISPEWGEKARAAAGAIAKDDVFDEQSASVMALADVSCIFETANENRLTSREIVEKLLAMKDRPWPEWRRGSPLTQNSLARLLRPFGIRPLTIRFAPKPANPVRGYERAPIEEAKVRFVDAPADDALEAVFEGPGPASEELLF